jgi:hypothetical protein
MIFNFFTLATGWNEGQRTVRYAPGDPAAISLAALTTHLSSLSHHRHKHMGARGNAAKRMFHTRQNRAETHAICMA